MGKHDLELKNERKQNQAKNARDSSKRYSEGNYECENILDMRIIKGHRYYFIKWKGYSTKDNTWEPVDNLLTIATDVLKFQNDKKQYIQNIQSKWNQLFHNQKVSEPLATNELRKIQRYLKKNEQSQEYSKKRRRDERSKKIKKRVENKLTGSSKTQKLQDQQSFNYKRKLRVRYTHNGNIKNDDQEIVNQNESQQISSIPVSNLSSQILNSQFFQEKQCGPIQESSHKKNCGTQSPIFFAKKPDLLEELLEHTKNSKACENNQKKPQVQKDIKQPQSKQILQHMVKKQTVNSAQISRKQTTAQTLSKNQAIQQSQKSKESSFRLSNYFIETPKKSSIYSSNSPIQRSLNKYIYRSKLSKNTNFSNEKEKAVEIMPHLELPIKDIFYDIISEKAQELQDQEHLKNGQKAGQEIKSQNDNLDESQNQEQKNISQSKVILQNRQHQQYLELDSHHQEEQKGGERKLFFQAQIEASNSDGVNIVQKKQQKIQSPNAQQKVDQINIQSQQNRSKQFILQDASTKKLKQQNRSQFQKLQRQINKDFNSIIFYNKSNPFTSWNKYPNHNEQHERIINNLQSENSQSARISSEDFSIKSKRHYNPRLIEQTINTSQISPKIKKIVKPYKSTSTHAYKKEKKNSDSESQNEPHFLYDLSHLLMNSISFHELRLRCIKVVKVIKMFKLQGCSIFIVVVQDGNEFDERFILYNLMRDFYPRLLLKYLEQNGKLEV